jgi:hypothetical protein
MACLSASLRAKYEADLIRVQEQLAKITITIDSALENGEVEEYSFNSTEGNQKTVRRSLKELYEIQEKLEATEARLIRRLGGRGLVSMNLRRKRYNYSYGRGGYGHR